MKFEYQWDNLIGPVLYIHIKKRKIGLCFCHRRKDRCVQFFGLEKYFCSRCLGIVIGFFIGLIFRIFFSAFPWNWALILMMPLVLDGFLQLLNHRESNNILRLITGLLFGFGIVIITTWSQNYVLTGFC